MVKRKTPGARAGVQGWWGQLRSKKTSITGGECQWGKLGRTGSAAGRKARSRNGCNETIFLKNTVPG